MSRISLIRFVLVWLALLLVGSLLPFNAKLALHTTGDHRIIHPLLHILAFAILGFLSASLAKSRQQIVLALVLVAAFGFSLEMIEIWAYPQKLEIADVRLDAYGAAVGCLLCAVRKRGLRGRQT